MTGVLIKRESLGTDTHREKAREDGAEIGALRLQAKERREAPASKPPEAGRGLEQFIPHSLQRNQPADTWLSDLQPPELETIYFCSLSHPVITAAPVNEYSVPSRTANAKSLR